MKNAFTCHWLLILATVSCVPAADAPPETASLPSAAAPKGAPLESKKTFDLVIRNGVQIGGGPGGQSPATISNLVNRLRRGYPGMNFVLNREAGSVTVDNLDLHSVDVGSFVKALEIATDGAVRGSKLGENTWALMAPGKSPASRPAVGRSVEVFNLWGYLHRSSNQMNEKEEQEALQSIGQLIGHIVEVTKEAAVFGDSHDESAKLDHPTFQVYPKASLLIVIGSPGAIDVARKVVNALPGQQTATTRAFRTESAPLEGGSSK